MALKPGVISWVGGGGKTTCIYTIAHELKEAGYSVVVTTTTKMFVPDSDKYIILNPTYHQLETLGTIKKTVVVASEIKENKLIGVKDECIQQLSNYVDFVLVEADGSKRKPLKVPRAYEPALPLQTNQVIIVIGLSCLHTAIERSCCRYEEVAHFLGKKGKDCIEIEDLYTLLTKTNGLKKGTENKCVKVLLNQWDCCHIQDEQAIDKLAYKLQQTGIDQVITSTLIEARWQERKGVRRC